jgi:hypothetical protein
VPYEFWSVIIGTVERIRGWIQGVNHEVTIVCVSNHAFLEMILSEHEYAIFVCTILYVQQEKKIKEVG